MTISGLIRGNQARVEAIERLANSSARAVIVHIDSPGGTTAGSEQLYDSLMRLKAKKPMVVVVDGLCASGGYIAALASDHIIAQSASLVGSIGVLIQYPNFTDLLKTVGVKVEDVKSSPLKASPNGFEPTSPEARAALASIVMDSYDWFKDLVAKRRSLEGEALATVSDGRVFTGRQAIKLQADRSAWRRKDGDCLARQGEGDRRQNPGSQLSVCSSRFSEFSFLHLTAVSMLNAVGLDGFARSLEQSGAFAAAERLNLDGMLALWHPSPVN